MIDVNDLQLVVPMSGLGKRFLDAGYTTPKSFIEVDGKPMVQHVVELFPGVKAENTMFICNNELESRYLQQLRYLRPGSSTRLVSVGLRGPVDVVDACADSIDDDRPVIVTYSDYGTDWNFQKFLQDADDFDGAIACYRGFHPHMLGTDNYAFVREQDGVLLEIKEKEPFTDNRMNEYASNGTYYFSSGRLMKKYFRALIDSGETVKGEFYVSMVYNLMAADGLRTKVFEIERMLQWGTPHDLEIYRGWSRYFVDSSKKSEPARNPPGTTLILPMAGRGSRFATDGYDLPKPLLPVDDKPMFARAVEDLPRSDREVYVCLQEHVNQFSINRVISSHRTNANMVAIDGVTEGQACTCEMAINALELDREKPIMISACDNGASYDEKAYQRLVDDPRVDVIVWSFRNSQASKSNPNAYAWLEVCDLGCVHGVSCKKFPGGDPLKSHAIIGTMFFRKARYFMDGLARNYELDRRVNGEFYVDDVVNRCIDFGLRVRVFEADHYVCWGTPNDYMTYEYWKGHFHER